MAVALQAKPENDYFLLAKQQACKYHCNSRCDGLAHPETDLSYSIDISYCQTKIINGKSGAAQRR
jgi:hypothetical protein